MNIQAVFDRSRNGLYAFNIVTFWQADKSCEIRLGAATSDCSFLVSCCTQMKFTRLVCLQK
jgi:hypothetical protein